MLAVPLLLGVSVPLLVSDSVDVSMFGMLAMTVGVPETLALGAIVDAGVGAPEGEPLLLEVGVPLLESVDVPALDIIAVTVGVLEALAPAATVLAAEGVTVCVGATHVKRGEKAEPRPA